MAMATTMMMMHIPIIPKHGPILMAMVSAINLASTSPMIAQTHTDCNIGT